LGIGPLQGVLITGVRTEIEGRRAESGEVVKLGLDFGVLGSPTDPDDVGAVLFDHEAAPECAEPAGPTDDYVDALLAVDLAIRGEVVHGDQLLAEPLPTTVHPSVALAVRRQAQHLVDDGREAVWLAPIRGTFQVDQAGAPVGIFLGHATG